MILLYYCRCCNVADKVLQCQIKNKKNILTRDKGFVMEITVITLKRLSPALPRHFCDAEGGVFIRAYSLRPSVRSVATRRGWSPLEP